MPSTYPVRCRGWFGLLVLTVASSCSSPPHRDFAAAATHVAAPAHGAVIPDLVSVAPDAVVLDLWLTELAERRQVPGIVAAVLRGNQIVARGAAGVRRKGSPEKVTPTDQFHIASCAKAMSAMVVARLVEEGKLDWGRPVSTYFADDRAHAAWDRITLRHLFTHTSGLKDPVWAFLANVYFEDGNLTERRARLAQRMLRTEPPAPPGERAMYQNISYILLAAVAEQVTGTAWEQLMEDYVFAPLKLESAGFGPPGTPGKLDQPWGHGKHRVLQLGLFGNAAFDPGARGADYPALASPAGYIHLSIDDWAAFVALHLRAHAANPQRNAPLLRPETYAALHEARPGIGYSGGWLVETRPWARGSRPDDIGRVLFHLGDNGRWTSAVWIAPEIDFAVLVSCNRGDMSGAVEEVVGQLVRQYAGSR